jgi:Ferritin-like
LMVEYLYAAYSLGGKQVPAGQRETVLRWRDNMLVVAKEEMGHLLTVQNILTLLGAPINLDRRDFPWDVPYYPFPFTLEPLTLKSLYWYIYAEAPLGAEDGPPGRRLPKQYRRFEPLEKERIITETLKRAKANGGRFHHVATIYKEIINTIQDPALISDSAFHEETYDYQASWDDWGRGYHPNPRPLDAEGNPIEVKSRQKLPPASYRPANVLISRAATRTQAVAALRQIAAQGEDPNLLVDDLGEPSHYERFLEIYQEFEKIKWHPARPVATNPTTMEDTKAGSYISAETSRKWAQLFNIRYRMLLTYLAHTFRLARVTRSDVPSVRAATMHRVFGEMYNLKTIAEILVKMPLTAYPNNPRRAGPPFEMPYSVTLPPTEADCWRMHRDLLSSSNGICADLLAVADSDGTRYLLALRHIDRETVTWSDRILAGLGPNERHGL